MKTFYALAWVFLALISIRLAMTGALDPVALVVLSLVAAALVYGLALWSVITNARDQVPQAFD